MYGASVMERPDPTEGFRPSDEELLQRENERLEREQTAQQGQAAQRIATTRSRETPPIGPGQVLAEVRKIRQLVGWLVMLLAVQFSVGFAVGFYLGFRDSAQNDAVLAWGSAIIAIFGIAAFAYLIFRSPSQTGE
jgi:hypothetical protein